MSLIDRSVGAAAILEKPVSDRRTFGIELTWKVWAQDELAFDAACLDTAVCVHDLVEA
jgi:hypothetical protein